MKVVELAKPRLRYSVLFPVQLLLPFLKIRTTINKPLSLSFYPVEVLDSYQTVLAVNVGDEQDALGENGINFKEALATTATFTLSRYLVLKGEYVLRNKATIINVDTPQQMYSK